MTQLVAWTRLLGSAVVACAWCAGCEAGGIDAQFEREVLPVLESRCTSAACHGVAPGDPMPEAGFFVRVSASGLVRDPAELEAAARERVTTHAPLLSSLLRAPLPREAGGVSHVGGTLFQGPDDPEVRGILRWIAALPDAAGGEDLQLDDLEHLFEDSVLPTLVARCARGGCHGPDDIAATAFAATPEPGTGRFAPGQVRATYAAARKHLDLWSDDAARSRLLQKALGSVEGGLVHRGGAWSLFPEAEPGKSAEVPEVQALLEWARRERAALGTPKSPRVTGLLFVRGPVQRRAPFRIEPEAPGTDLFLSDWPYDATSLRNLSAALHPEGPASVRDPALSHDARRVALAVRRQGEAHYGLWEIELESGRATRIETDLPGNYVQPQYAPDQARLIAVWDGHGEVGADGPGSAPELVAIDPAGHVQRLTFTPAPEVTPSFLATGKTRGQLLFATRRSGSWGAEGVLFRFPLCRNPDAHGDAEYHAHFGATLSPYAPLAARDLPDGRQVFVSLLYAYWFDDRGKLALLDRSLGPNLRPAQSSSLGGQRQPVVWLDAAERYRDPAPLPDGRILVARDSVEAPEQDALYLVTLRDDAAGAALDSVELVAQSATESLRSPVPVFARPPEDDPHKSRIDPDERDGYLALRDVAMLEALYGRAEPSGARSLLDEIRRVRMLGWGGTRAEAAAFAGTTGTRFGLSSRMPTRWLAEFELAEDRSLWLQVPARTPLQLQWLDARGMMLGYQLDRWYYADGDETVPAGTNERTYGLACGGCHGSLSGAPEAAAARAPDALSSASVTLSTHEGRDRRRPLAPRVLDAEPRAIDFVHDLAGRLEQHCAALGCHGGEQPAAELALDGRTATQDTPFGPAYTALVTRYVDLVGLRARRSVLVERLLGEELEAPEPVTGRCPPGGVEPELLQDIVRWIEIGAFHDSQAGSADAP